MVLTHKVENIEITKDKKTTFERFKGFIKEKTFLVAVPFVLTFTIPVYAEEKIINYGAEEVEKVLEIKINSNMKNSYLDFKEGKIDMKKLEVEIFKELYKQVKEQDFDSTKLAHAVEELIGQLSGMNLEREVKRKHIPKKKEKKVEEPKPPAVDVENEMKFIPAGDEKKAVQHFSESLNKLEEIARENDVENENIDGEVITSSVPLFEEVDNFELVFNRGIKKINNALEQLLEQYNNEKYKTIKIDVYTLEANNDKIGASAIVHYLIKELVILEENTMEESKNILSKIDRCDVCTDKGALKNIVTDIIDEIPSIKKEIAFKTNSAGIFEGKNEDDIKVVKVNEEMSEDEKLEMEYEAKLEEIRLSNTKNKKDKTKWKFTSEVDVKKQANTVPSFDNRGIVNETININVGNSIIGKSGVGLDLVTGYSAELVSFMNNIYDTRDSNIIGSKYYEPYNHLARMLLGLSYNSEEISLSLMGGYKIGKLYTSNVLGREGYYPIIAGGLESTKDQLTKLKFEIPVLFNVGQNMNVSLEHFSKYIFINSNVDFSRQSSLWITENDNIVKDTFKVLNNQNFIGVTLYPFKVKETTISPTLFVMGGYNGLNAENLQKVQSWNIGPGLGLNALYKDKPLLVLGYGYGMGKYDAKYTDFEGVNSYKLKLFYSTHNVLIRLYAPITENLNINSEFTFVKGDAKGTEGIKSPMNDYSRFLLLLTYVY